MTRNKEKTITHKGVIQSIQDNLIRVSINNVSACSSCHSKGFCSLADMKEKHIDIYDFSKKYAVGEKVTVVGKQAIGIRAAVWAYLVPIVIVLTTLFVSSAFINNEGIVALYSIGVLIPYYIILYLLRNKFTREFRFKIKEI